MRNIFVALSKEELLDMSLLIWLIYDKPAFLYGGYT